MNKCINCFDKILHIRREIAKEHAKQAISHSRIVKMEKEVDETINKILVENAKDNRP